MTSRARAAAPPLAMTMGEPAGIGPDITLKAWARRHVETLAPFFVVAAPEVLAGRARLLGMEAPIEAISEPAMAAERFDRAVPVLPIPCPESSPGAPSSSTAAAVIASIERCVELVRSGAAAAVVTNPIAKSVLAESGFAYPGHTEFLAALAGGAPPPRPVMMLAAPDLRVVPVTIHMALRDVVATLTGNLIEDTAKIVAAGLARHFAIARPRLAVAALNPHAGEGGLFGDEDMRIVAPAIARLREAGIDATGPHAADTLFHPEARRRYDAALCMYHDQALIPVKTIAFDDAVNVTLGLPFVRTSPDHGTAFDIAGTGEAREASLVAAIRLAATASRPAAPETTPVA